MGKTRQIKMFDDLADGGGQVFSYRSFNRERL